MPFRQALETRSPSNHHTICMFFALNHNHKVGMDYNFTTDVNDN
jgi:hypothetical protein